jgi:hypothetical protein
MAFGKVKSTFRKVAIEDLPAVSLLCITKSK